MSIFVSDDDEDDLCGLWIQQAQRYFRRRVLFLSVGALAFLGLVMGEWRVFEQAMALPIVYADTTAVIATDAPLSVCSLKKEASRMFLNTTSNISLEKNEICDDKEIAVNQIANTVMLQENTDFAEKLTEVVKGFPLEAMVGTLAKQDKEVAGFAVGIGKQESNWGKFAPTKSGEDCFNYWGYKGRGEAGSVDGYACFATADEAVETVSRRIETFVKIQHRDTPEKMLIWKCGSSCAGHSPQGVKVWLASVSLYYDKVVQ
jgi:hypothetical protein